MESILGNGGSRGGSKLTWSREEASIVLRARKSGATYKQCTEALNASDAARCHRTQASVMHQCLNVMQGMTSMDQFKERYKPLDELGATLALSTAPDFTFDDE